MGIPSACPPQLAAADVGGPHGGTGSSRTRAYVLGLASGYVVSAVSLGVGFWLTPYVLRFLTRKQYGIYALASSVMGWFQMLDFGMSAALRLHLAQLAGRADRRQISGYVSTTVFVQAGIAVLVLLGGVSSSLWFAEFFNTGGDQRNSVTFLLCLLGSAAAVSLATRSFSSLLVAHQQLHVDNFIRLGLLAVQTFLTVVLLGRGWGVLALGTASLAAVAIAGASSVLRSYRTVPGLSIRIGLFSAVLLKQLWGTAVWFTVSSVAILLIKGLDHAVAAKLISLEAVTVFALTKRPYDIIEVFLAQLVATASPGLGQLAGRASWEKFREAYCRLAVFGTGLAIAAASAVWAANQSFISAWVGSSNYGGWKLDLALALVVVARQWTLPHRATLSASLNVRSQSICGLVEGAVNFALSIVLTLTWGLWGVAASTVLGLLLTSGWYVPRLATRQFPAPAEGFWADAMRRLLLHLALCFSVAAGLRWLTRGHRSYLWAVLNGAVAGLVGLSGFWGVALDEEGRSEARALVARLVAGWRPTVA
jgi:O-antigen/teichoic acid export membrane protein